MHLQIKKNSPNNLPVSNFKKSLSKGKKKIIYHENGHLDQRIPFKLTNDKAKT